MDKFVGNRNKEYNMTSTACTNGSNEGNSNKNKLSKSEVWKYFNKMSGSSAKCKACGKIYKTCGNTSNLRDHIRRLHPDIKFSHLRDLPKSSGSILSFIEKKYDKSSARKILIDNTVSEFIACSIQPFTLVEEKSFRKLMKVMDPRYELPSRKTLKHVQMENLFIDMKAKLCTTLDKVEHLAITTDLWTSRKSVSFITITCHFIDDDYILRSAVLSTNLLLNETNHSAKNIGETVRSVLDNWQIFNKVYAIVTDNDKVMTKMCEKIQKRNLPCFAHALNLIVQEALKMDVIHSLIEKCKLIVKFFKQSNVSYAKLRNAQRPGMVYSLKQEIPTRWNSALAMIQRIILINEVIGKVLLSIPKAPAPLTAEEVATLMEIVELLAPFNTATEKVSSSTNVTVSLIIPVVCGLLDTMESLKPKVQTKEVSDMLLNLIDSSKRRLLEYEKRTMTRLSTLLDPRFKKEGFLFSHNVSEAVKALENELTHHNKNHAPDNTGPPTPTDNSAKNQPLFAFLKRNISNKPRTERVDSILSLRNYYDSPNLDYWKNMNGNDGLKACCKKILCIPATSVESERIFSKAGNVISQKRASLQASTADMIIFMSRNNWLLEED